MSTNVYPRETTEFCAVTITVNGAPVTTGVTICLTPHNTRPVTWVAPTTLNGAIGVMLTGLTPGYYDIWAKISSSPETPVIDCGYIQIT